MTIKTNQQKVQIFERNTKISGELIVLIDTAEDWISIVLFGDEISMNLKNWDKLVALVEATKAKDNY